MASEDVEMGESLHNGEQNGMTHNDNTSAHPPSFDLGNLLINDPTPLSTNATQQDLYRTAQRCAQSLIAALLNTCPMHTTSDKAVLMTLPPSTTPIPREKPLPKPKEKTKWERFAEKKGIGKKDSRKETGGKVYDEATGEWVRKWGYKGKNKEGENEWIVEVDDAEKEKKGLEDGKTIRGEGRRERKEKAKRQDRKERANDRKGRKGTGG